MRKTPEENLARLAVLRKYSRNIFSSLRSVYHEAYQVLGDGRTLDLEHLRTTYKSAMQTWKFLRATSHRHIAWFMRATGNWTHMYETLFGLMMAAYDLQCAMDRMYELTPRSLKLGNDFAFFHDETRYGYDPFNDTDYDLIKIYSQLDRYEREWFGCYDQWEQGLKTGDDLFTATDLHYMRSYWDEYYVRMMEPLDRRYMMADRQIELLRDIDEIYADFERSLAPLKGQLPWQRPPTLFEATDSQSYFHYLSDVREKTAAEKKELLHSLELIYYRTLNEINHAARSIEGTAGQAKPAPKQPRPHSKPKEPSTLAVEAYRIYIMFGKTQDSVAGILSRMHNIDIQQYQVSRWLKEVRRFLEDGGTLPEIINAPRTVSFSPQLLNAASQIKNHILDFGEDAECEETA